MASQDTTRDNPSQNSGTRRDENRGQSNRPRGTRMASDATGINPEDSGPIDPRMPNMPPA